jgi:hypothetical protein
MAGRLTRACTSLRVPPAQLLDALCALAGRPASSCGPHPVRRVYRQAPSSGVLAAGRAAARRCERGHGRARGPLERPSPAPGGCGRPPHPPHGRRPRIIRPVGAGPRHRPYPGRSHVGRCRDLGGGTSREQRPSGRTRRAHSRGGDRRTAPVPLGPTPRRCGTRRAVPEPGRPRGCPSGSVGVDPDTPGLDCRRQQREVRQRTSVATGSGRAARVVSIHAWSTSR